MYLCYSHPPPPKQYSQCVRVIGGVGCAKVFVVVLVVVVGPNCVSPRAAASSRQKGAPRLRPSSGDLSAAPQRAPRQPTHDGSGWASPWQQGKPKEGGMRSLESVGEEEGRYERFGAGGWGWWWWAADAV